MLQKAMKIAKAERTEGLSSKNLVWLSGQLLIVRLELVLQKASFNRKVQCKFPFPSVKEFLNYETQIKRSKKEEQQRDQSNSDATSK